MDPRKTSQKMLLVGFFYITEGVALELVSFVPVKQERQELCNVVLYDIIREKCFFYDYMETVGKKNVCLKE